MDFLSRLIGGGKAKKQPTNQPQHRLARFKKTNSQTLQIWHKINASSADPDSITLHLIQVHIQRLTTLLEDDNRAPAPHLCLAFAASSYVYTAIGRIALTLQHEAIVREVVTFFTILVDNDEEGLLGKPHFAETLSNFSDGVLAFAARTGADDIQSEILELIFGIAAKIRLDPDLLPVWFKSGSIIDVAGEQEKFESISDADFPLCHQFVGYVYHDGKAGDFARTGLLYILESASNSPHLEKWIASSDLPTLMASGLGGLYSQLSRKVTIARPKESLPIILALSDALDEESSTKAEPFFSEELQKQLDTFMSYMIFWQDVLEHCHSSEIKKTLLDRFQVEFLEQILYPSLLQSSDRDGGSSVAVLTYLHRILTSVNHPDIIHLILHYLLALPGPSFTGSLESSSLNRDSPQSEVQPEPFHNTMNPSYFDLTDLILAGCQSVNPETTTAALRLVTIVLEKHHPYAISSLIKTTSKTITDTSKSIKALSCDLEILIQIAKQVGGEDGTDEAYESNLKDCLTHVEAHPCLVKSVDQASTPARHSVSRQLKESPTWGQTIKIQSYSISLDDPLLKHLDSLIRSFFTNSVETNLSLTSAISSLASCPYTRLDGWLMSFPSGDVSNAELNGDTEIEEDQIGGESEVTETQRIAAYKAGKIIDEGDNHNTSLLLTSFDILSTELQKIRSDIPEFDHFLSGRKRAFIGAIELEMDVAEGSVSVPMSPRGSLDISRDGSVSRALPNSNILPSKSTSQQGLSTSPRGRTPSNIGGTGRLSNTSSPVKFDKLRRPTAFDSPALRSREGSRGPSRSPSKAARTLSPLSATFDSEEIVLPSPIKSSVGSESASVDEEIFERKIHFSATNSAATLAHVLTNAVILQEFILELAAIIHVRAGLMPEDLKFI